MPKNLHLSRIGHQMIKLRDCCHPRDKLEAVCAGAAMDAIYEAAEQLAKENAELTERLARLESKQLPLGDR